MHLKQRGVSFELCAEAEAARIPAGQNHYFRLAAYRVLFPKRVGGPRDGQYARLDFGHLVDLAAIDRELHGDWYASNTVITSSHDFIARVFEAWLG